MNSLPTAGLLTLILTVSLAIDARCAGPNKVYGPQFAWCNNFHGSPITATFPDGDQPGLTATFDFDKLSLYGFPACVRGWHYGFNPAKDDLFPMAVSAAASVPCTFSYSARGTALKGDFAYDLFLRRDDARAKPQLEIMIWADNNSRPIGKCTAPGALSAGGRTFDLWEGPNNPAGYYVYSFKPISLNPAPAKLPAGGALDIDLKPFFDWLQANRSKDGRYDDAMFLDVVEAGFEIVCGHGSVTVSADVRAHRKEDAPTPTH